jgi:threonylcarbamoyladenosine tRNA methylthiotransferase MtaB
MKYSIITFGCRVNQADSIGFEEEFHSLGATRDVPERADVVVVNTCSVTATADQGARQVIRRVARENPKARIVVTGCYATRSPEEIAALPQVATVVCNDDKPHLVRLTRRAGPLLSEGGATTAERFAAGDGACGAPVEPGVAGRTAYTLRVQTGCAQSCSYCIIPSTRGRPRSVPIDQVLAEADRVIASGFREIAITGVHLGSYGRDLDDGSSLVGLLRALADCGERSTTLFRISSLEPMDCSAAVVEAVAGSDWLASHFHLPLQHASGGVLKRMRRPYTIDAYATLVRGIRETIPHAFIGSDVIVGFPGETDGDFEELSEYLEHSPLTQVHVFPYSDRAGTEASAFGAKVHGATVRERGRRVREIGQRLADRFKSSQIGTVHSGLTIEDGSLVVTDNYLKLRIGPGLPRNRRVRVRVTSHQHGELLAG